MIERIDAFLGHPTRDPHGDPIPSADGVLHRPDAVPLTEATPGVRARVARISDADAGLLKYLAARGITLDTELDVLPADPYADGVEVTVGGQPAPIHLGATASSSIWVIAVEPGQLDA
jgi:DtxR family Mn-dependent transcriptional regulator